jgi:hypothetical protein
MVALCVFQFFTGCVLQTFRVRMPRLVFDQRGEDCHPVIPAVLRPPSPASLQCTVALNPLYFQLLHHYRNYSLNFKNSMD